MFLSTWFKAPGLVYLFSLHQIITLYWQSEDKNFRRGSTWRRQFPSRERTWNQHDVWVLRNTAGWIQVNYDVWAVEENGNGWYSGFAFVLIK